VECARVPGARLDYVDVVVILEVRVHLDHVVMVQLLVYLEFSQHLGAVMLRRVGNAGGWWKR
jgi:hypothetical protein